MTDRIRNAMSSFWALGDVSEELGKLARDLESGAWAERHADLLALEAYDAGYRLVVTQ